MKTFQLPTGESVIVDDEDYDRVMAFKWSRNKPARVTYVATYLKRVNGKQQCVRLHRFLMGAKIGQEVDHRSGDGLDNRKENLRLLTPLQNRLAFRRKILGCSSRYRGVCWIKRLGKWAAKIYRTIDGKFQQIHLGVFISETDAAMAFNRAAIALGFLPEALNKI